MNMVDLEGQFDEAMYTLYRRARDEAGYNATIFLRMLTDGRGLRTARTLINAPKPSDGYTALWERKRLDLTVEALVQDARWRPLFSQEEIERARRRLSQYGYELPTANQGAPP